MEDIRTEERYGAAEIKRDYNRNLVIGLGISVLLHGLVVAYCLLISDVADYTPVKLPEIPRPHVDTTWYAALSLNDPKKHDSRPEGGGAPDAKAPVGPAQRGDPNAVPDHSRNYVDPKRSVQYTNPANVRPVPNDPKHPNLAGDTHDTSKATGVVGTRGQNPNGTSTQPHLGSGGVGIGFADGMGGRGWVVKPNATYPDGLNATGTVVLRFTVLPNGAIINVTPIKRADAALVRAAISGLTRSKARPLPDNVPQIAQTATIPFTFKLP